MGTGGVTWVKCTYLGLLGELRDDKAGFSSDDSVDHHFQTWAIIVSIHSCVVAYCVAVTGICIHAWTSLKRSSEQVHPTYYYAWWASTTIMAMQRHRPIKLSIFWVSVALFNVTDRMLAPDNHFQWVNSGCWCHTAHKHPYHHRGVTIGWDNNTQSTTVSHVVHAAYSKLPTIVCFNLDGRLIVNTRVVPSV